MEIQTYLLRESKTMDSFGEYFNVNSWDFEWYLGEERIGITNNPSTEAESFMKGFLVREDKLIITPSDKRPMIQRKSDSYGRMRGNDGGLKEISDLVDLIFSQEKTHVFQTLDKKRHDKILTFSPTAPNEENYEPKIVIPIIVDVDL